jgi:uncharacterized protein YndB with AHSA1/START domain
MNGMATLKKSEIINAPIEKVFRYWQDPTNRLEVWPSLIEVTEVKELPTGGHSWRWVYKLGGVRLEGTSEDIEFIANQRMVDQSKGGIESTFKWTFEPQDSGTRMGLEVEYIVPIPVLGKLAESFIIKLNENEANLVFVNLKARLEA